MPGLLGALQSAGNALTAYQQALNVVQNNITNANTPGYATQAANLVAQPFDVAGGLAGGVAAQGLLSARDEYAEDEVRRQLQSLGVYQTQAQATGTLAANFDATGNTGIPAELNQLFSSFSSWAVNPNGATERQGVLNSASNLANGVRSLAASLARTNQNVLDQTSQTVQQINKLTAQIQQLNIEQLKDRRTDPGKDAQMHAALEQLSQLVNFTQLKQADGTMTLILSGGAPLVIGDQQYSLSAASSVPAGAANPQAPASSQILDAQGNDITGQITGGKLAGFLDVRNRIMASLLGDGNQTGSLNQFAKSLADTINGILRSGVVSTAAGAPNGSPLFTYNNADATIAASTFAVDPAITIDQLAAVDPNGNANGIALQLASLQTSAANGGINGQTFGQAFAQIASYVGNENSTANTNQQGQQEIVAQTRDLRDHISGVSLDQQAVQMLQFQKSYQAAARLMTVIDGLTQTLMNIVQ
jgi:flagellar hook-associated protein 1